MTASHQQTVTGPPNESKYPYLIHGNPYAADCAYTPYFVYPQHGQYQYPVYPRQQAEPQVLPPIVYPMQVNKYPGHAEPKVEGNKVEKKQEPDNSATNEDETDELHFMDSVESKDDPNMPLTPLPAPLVPEVLLGAKKAAVMKNYGVDGEFIYHSVG